MLARLEEELTEIMKKLEGIGREHGFTLNKKKTKIIIIDLPMFDRLMVLKSLRISATWDRLLQTMATVTKKSKAE